MSRHNEHAAARVGLITCAALPSGDVDDVHLTNALHREDIDVDWVVWNTSDPRTLGSDFDALVVRSPWDYPEHHQQFLRWLADIDVPVHNPAALVEWNSDKRYLLDLAAAGVPTVSTQIVESLEQTWQVPVGFDEFVVKPSIGVGSLGARRFGAHDRQSADQHVAFLIESGRPAMVQPYLPSVDAGSETSLIHFDGTFSHSITKGPMLARDGQRPLVDDLYVVENIDARQASDEQRELGRQALAAIPAALSDGPPLYARVDVVEGDDGVWQVLELELIEPSLFFGFDPQAARRAATAIAGRL